MARQIKRYGNRKLYDTQESRYVTLEDIATFVKGGEDIRVVDNDSHEDLTAVTFAQIILEEERREKGFLPVDLLRGMIQHGEQTIQTISDRVDKEMENIRSIGEKAGRRVQEFVGVSQQGGKTLVEDLLKAPQRRLENLQRRIDSSVKESVERIRSFQPSIQRELGRIEKSIQRLEEQIMGPNKGPDPSSSEVTPDDESPRRANEN